ncbi:MAG TPA: DUF4340 domain-containing protein [Parvibaculum sp.]
MAVDLQMLRSNKPLRNLVLLAVATGIAVIAATAAVFVQANAVRVKFAPVAMYPGLESRLDQVVKIQYTLARGMRAPDKITLVRGTDGRWTVAERKNYPANQDLVRKALVGVSELNLYEPRTALPAWHRNLGLLAPEDLGSATRVQFYDKDGKLMAAFLAGKVPDQTADARGQGMIYVRRDGENQTWLARGRFPLFQTAQDWLDTSFLGLKRDDVKRLTLWAGTDHPVVISRAAKDDSDFALENIPKGRVTRGAPVVDGVANSLVDLAFEDAVPAGSLDFPATSPQVVVETFDGIRITFVITGGGGGLWAKILAAADPALMPPGTDMKAADARAREIEARVSPWTYKLPQPVGNQLTQSMDLLTHEDGPAK